ncbi:anillin-like [Diorhabda sublineata]|uniref:anillin-like n=1 Tax=Diorhabda sublineata TaxID=1163346 RepID=UPI0024E156F1|nr:anillin-like [Diorhabda sublineata]
MVLICNIFMCNFKFAKKDVSGGFEIEKNAMYYKMRKLRDIECVKMKEASNALEMIRNSTKSNWNEEILAESILLQSQLRYKLIVDKICESKDLYIEIKKRKLSGSITLSNIQFELLSKDQKTPTDCATFYLLAISHDTIVTTTKPIEADGQDRLLFDEVITVTDLDDDFELKAELFSITICTEKRGIIGKLLRKKPKCCCPIKKIYYENVNTSELIESSILKPSFKSCGTFLITAHKFGISKIPMQKQEIFSVRNYMKAKILIEDVTLNTDFCGFITLGELDRDNHINFWERKWCCLRKNTLYIYNYPQDEQFEKDPVVKMNLEHCVPPLTKNPDECPRKRSFALKIGVPRIMGANNAKFRYKKDDFVFKKYYLNADNREDFENWTVLLDSALQQLSTWNKIKFK